jgi:hypothetical protein
MASIFSTNSANAWSGRDTGVALTPLELIDRIAALGSPPRIHRHRYFGAGANGRSLEISGATANGWLWPTAAVPHLRRKLPLENPSLFARTAAYGFRRELTLSANSGHSCPKKLTSGMTGVKAEQTLLIVATAVKKSTKWALKD